jgi:amidase
VEEAFRIMQAREVWESYGDFVRSANPEFGPGIKERIAFAATVTAEQADAARKVMAAARAHVRTLIPPGTVMALPTAPCIAPPLDLPDAAQDDFRTRAIAASAAPAELASILALQTGLAVIAALYVAREVIVPVST